LLAVDGSVTLNLPDQLLRLPREATRLILSVGGNDALMKSEILNTPARSTSEALTMLADIADRFEEDYRFAVEACLRTTLPLALCTIYNGCFDDRALQRTITTALKVFNDTILRVGFEFRLPMIDLRYGCASAKDFANPIEPSSVGGAKIARAIVNLVSHSADQAVAARVFVA